MSLMSFWLDNIVQIPLVCFLLFFFYQAYLLLIGILVISKQNLGKKIKLSQFSYNFI